MYSYELSDAILYKMEKHIRETIPIGTGINTWFISMKREIFNSVRQTIASRIWTELERLNFPVLTTNGFMKDHLTENMAFVFSSCLFNEEYFNTLLTTEYKCLDIPTNTIFYNPSTINVNKDTLAALISNLTTKRDETGNIINVPLNTTDKVYQKEFDNTLERKILDILHKIPNIKIEQIITKVYTNFKTKQDREELIIKNNSQKNNIDDRFSSFV